MNGAIDGAPAATAAPSAASATLAQWLSWLERLHPVEIELGLERIGRVARRAELLDIDLPIITVAGTNGKGSTVAMLAAIYRQAGYRVGDYTSPHIDSFNERIRLQGLPVDEATIVAALARIEAVREGESLTYYEYTTLAAMLIFTEARCEVLVLEVGLGGRLDATNLWSADCAIVTSIALDHQAWLGVDRAAISLEKVAIGRAGRPMIIGDTDPPPGMLAHAREVGMRVLRPDLEGGGGRAAAGGFLRGEHQRRNRACVLAAVEAMQPRLPVDAAVADDALRTLQVPGRMESRCWQGRQVLLDVAHNPAAAHELANLLKAEHPGEAIDVVFAVLADKDAAGIVRELAPYVRHWHCVELSVPRALPLDSLVQVVTDNRCVSESHAAQQNPVAVAGTTCSDRPAGNAGRVFAHADAQLAWDAVAGEMSSALILVTGSFYTVAGVLGSWRGSHEH